MFYKYHSSLYLILARKSAPPLDVSGLPGYDKISDKEREVILM